MNQLQMELTDKNTVIYNLYKKIECLEQALMISKQRMNSQSKEIEVRRESSTFLRLLFNLQELRSRHETVSASMNREHVRYGDFMQSMVHYSAAGSHYDRWIIDR